MRFQTLSAQFMVDPSTSFGLSNDGRHYNVAVARCAEQGNTAAQALANARLDELASTLCLLARSPWTGCETVKFERRQNNPSSHTAVGRLRMKQ